MGECGRIAGMEVATPDRLFVKACSKCGETKSLQDFPIRRISSRRGVTRKGVCQACTNTSSRVRYARNPKTPAKQRARAKAFVRRADSPRHTLNINLLTALRYRPCDNPITLDELEQVFVSQGGRCALSGIEMTWAKGKLLGTSITLDRIDHDGGYTVGNVRLLCHAVNSFRGRMSDAEMVAMARAIVAMADRVL